MASLCRWKNLIFSLLNLGAGMLLCGDEVLCQAVSTTNGSASTLVVTTTTDRATSTVVTAGDTTLEDSTGSVEVTEGASNSSVSTASSTTTTSSSTTTTRRSNGGGGANNNGDNGSTSPTSGQSTTIDPNEGLSDRNKYIIYITVPTFAGLLIFLLGCCIFCNIKAAGGKKRIGAKTNSVKPA